MKIDCKSISFFFSSRRRHTRLQGDWSSDVRSSDLWVDIASGKIAASSAAATGALTVSGDPQAAKRLGKIFRRRHMLAGSRSEERRVGKEWRSGWRLNHENEDYRQKEGAHAETERRR